MGIPKQLLLFEIRKIITFSHLNSINFNYNFKDNFMQEKVNKIASKAKTLNISTVEPNWKWIHDDLILSLKVGLSHSKKKFLFASMIAFQKWWKMLFISS